MPIQLSGSLVITGSITTTGGITISGSILSASYSDTASFSNNFRVLGNLTASTALVTGTLTAQTLVVQTVTSSIVYSSGSNIFGNQLSDRQTFTGSVNITGSLALAGNITGNAATLTGALGGTSANFSSSVTATGTINAIGSSPVFRNTDNSVGNVFDVLWSVGGSYWAYGVAGFYDATNSQKYDEYKGGASGFRKLYTNGTLALTIASTGAATFSSSVTTGNTLYVNGDSNSIYQKALTANSALYWDMRNSADARRAFIGFGGTADSSFAFNLNENGPMDFNTNNTFRMRIAAGGNVGIGTDSPDGVLTIKGANDANLLSLQNSGGGTAAKFQISENNGLYITSFEGTVGRLISFSTLANGAESMRITSAGNVGIGITNPTDTDGYGGKVLDVNGPGYFRDNSDNTKYVSIGSVSSIGFIEANGTGNYLRFYTGGSGEKMRITTDGYTKMSPTGTYAQSSGYYHECYGGAANGYTLIVTSPVATPLSQYVFDIRFSAATPNNTSARFLHCSDATATRAIIRSNGGLANYQANNTDLSDIRTKKDIISLESYWNKFKALEIVKYKYKDQTHEDYNIGVIAQQVEAVAPEFVDVDGWSKNDIESESPLKSIYTKDLYHATIKVLQEAMAKIETLEAKVTALETK